MINETKEDISVCDLSSTFLGDGMEGNFVREINQLSDFALTEGNGQCFVRTVGVNYNYCDDIRVLDQRCGKAGFYKRTGKLPNSPSAGEETVYYQQGYRQYNGSGKRNFPTKCGSRKDSPKLAAAMNRLELFCREKIPNITESAMESIVILSMYWLDVLFDGENKDVFSEVQKRVVISSVTRRNEYLFAYFLTMLGVDVLLLQYDRDIDMQLESLGISQKLVIGDFSRIDIPPFLKDRNIVQEKKLVVKLPPRPQKQYSPPVSTLQIPQRQKPSVTPQLAQQREKSYEELALLASSVVLIVIMDKRGNPVGSGSGIMIGENGYILTNNHVVNGGCYFSVRIENDNNIYETNEVIKYNSVMDMAVIRIRRRLDPLTVYNGRRELVRGQRVVAIGSPLGLFNSVSDGIISGIRELDGIDMIQFTAPISSGSSGGALLNMYGEVIGISTAGIDNGQNLNLAVGYKYINMFINGFV